MTDTTRPAPFDPTPRTPLLCVALDVPALDDAVSLARRVAGAAALVKVGYEAIYTDGPTAFTRVANVGVPVFADTKLHDIPRTVHAAARAVGAAGVACCTIHLGGGEEMARAAIDGVSEGAAAAGVPRPLVLGVTVLTSLDDAALQVTGHTRSASALVARRAALAATAGCDGVVCAVSDCATVGAEAPGLLRVTPGIRPAGADAGDQARTGTPEAAVAAGADVLVVGRPVVAAADPAAAAAAIAATI
jgi:orotidine-5'-phosphate decarboxylase